MVVITSYRLHAQVMPKTKLVWPDCDTLQVLDADGSGSLNFKEFKSACRTIEVTVVGLN